MTKSHYALVIRAALRWMLRVSAAFPHHEIHECKYSGNKESRALFTSFTFLIFIPRLFLFAPPPSIRLCFFIPALSFLRYFPPCSLCSSDRVRNSSGFDTPAADRRVRYFSRFNERNSASMYSTTGGDRCSLPRYKSPSFCPGVYALL